MSGQRDPFILTDATLLIRYVLLLIAGLFLTAGFAGAGFVVTFFALFVIFSLGISFTIVYQTVRHLELRRVVPNNRTFENALAHVTVKIDNGAPFACLLCQLDDRFPPAGRERQLVSVNRPLMGHSQYDIPLEFVCLGKRGQYTIGPLRLVAHDPLGLFTLAAFDEQRHDFFVYPPPFDVPDFTFQGLASSFTFGPFDSRRLGNGLEFAGIREYREWDDTRHMHWPATGRTGRLMVKEFDQTGAVRVNIFFDLSKASLCGIGRHATTEYAIKIAGSLAKLAIEQGNQVQVLAEGDRLVYVPFASGMWHLTEIMQELARVRAEGGRPLYDLISQYVDLVPEHSNAILIFSKCDIDVDAYLSSIRLLRARNVRITAIIIDHTTFLPVFENHNYRISQLARQTLLKQGVVVYLVKQGDDLARALSLPLTVEREVR